MDFGYFANSMEIKELLWSLSHVILLWYLHENKPFRFNRNAQKSIRNTRNMSWNSSYAINRHINLCQKQTAWNGDQIKRKYQICCCCCCCNVYVIPFFVFVWDLFWLDFLCDSLNKIVSRTHSNANYSILFFLLRWSMLFGISWLSCTLIHIMRYSNKNMTNYNISYLINYSIYCLCVYLNFTVYFVFFFSRSMLGWCRLFRILTADFTK